jgi:RimJ/RimL family protein N-acetyltransferase
MLTITSAIATDRLLLRPFTANDLDDLYAIQSGPEVVRYLRWDVRSRDEVRAVLLSLAIVLPGAAGTRTGAIGEVSLWWHSREHRQGEIGFVLHPAFHGHGYAAEAARAVLSCAFGAAGLHRVYGRADARNAASAALMRRLGMRQEAHFIHNEVFKGEWGDELVFAILESEWND